MNRFLGPHGEPLDYSRISALGYPFVGTPELLPDDQLRAESRTVYRFGYASFNTANRRKRFYGRTYGEVLEGVANSDFKLVHKSPPVIETDGSVTVYIEWYEPLKISRNAELPPRVEEDFEEAATEMLVENPPPITQSLPRYVDAIEY